MGHPKIIEKSFYLRSDVALIARELLGKKLVTVFGENITSGLIVETEAYAGKTDRASHAYGGKVTPRNKVMYQEGGIAYVYLCYGIHSLFNVVTNVEGIPHAVLIRGIIPLDGVGIMLSRSGQSRLNKKSGIGPGKLSKLLGIHYSHSGLPVTSAAANAAKLQIRIEHNDEPYTGKLIATPRIGVDYAGEDALLPYRFCLQLNS